ncbi:MAG: tetratricopeptide repeat protein [Vicinamibacterales bacterium]|jgi:tetratricopeptide (TPR) repeat protein|nr:hypothetical protein [Acidobacteriota bacterium]MDP7295765.1 tetratricopeptide repeat protein [Vicinamibacterales bacterium]MDP7472924.1 tetratricopeptide repeat protein [Vicinamibacterales bacterium]MDP7672273.1 tetratricopeptide repeat protein [Vicinamibacterales bacterium]HJO37693.1 tetratricopeptide repeat protein [Vicinamibacterales bacterium]
MKRSERHHLKENALAAWLADVADVFETRSREVFIWAALAVVALVLVGGYVSYQQSADLRGTDLLADALNTASAPVVPPPPAPDPSDPTAAPPAAAFQPGSFTSEGRRAEAALEKFILAAEAFPESPAGITARYHAASLLGTLGRREEAEAYYAEVVALAGDNIYGRMARLGLAETSLNGGNADAAIALFEEALNLPDAQVPVDGILMRLGRAYLRAGRPVQAEESFARIVDEFPQSIYGPMAQAELDDLQTPDAEAS